MVGGGAAVDLLHCLTVEKGQQLLEGGRHTACRGLRWKGEGGIGLGQAGNGSDNNNSRNNDDDNNRWQVTCGSGELHVPDVVDGRRCNVVRG